MKNNNDVTDLFELLKHADGSYFANKDGIVVQIYGKAYSGKNATEVMKQLRKLAWGEK